MAAYSDSLGLVGLGLPVVALFSIFHVGWCLVADNNDLCGGGTVVGCHPNQSALCVRDISEFPVFCNHQLNDVEIAAGNCYFNKIAPTACSIEGPSYISEPDELPFSIQMYYYNTWMHERPLPNLTFNSPTWKSLKFRYQGRENKKKILCRKFLLSDLNLPLKSSLTWDCPFFESPNYLGHTFDLSVITNDGRGGRYAFRVPDKSRFKNNITSLKDWQVFFFLHMDHFQYTDSLPITIQLAPFANLTYNVSLLKCLEDDTQCDRHAIIASIHLEDPEMNAVPVGSVKQLITKLSSWSNPARYAVSVQINSAECPVEGCYLSVSPVFEVEESQLALWLCIAFGFIFLFGFAFALTHQRRTKENRKLLLTLKDKPTRVLMLYLPENPQCLEVIKKFAKFLKDTCYVLPSVIDFDIGNMDPNLWTREHVKSVRRILIFIPGNPHGVSVTPIRDQWHYALRHLTGPHFVLSNFTDKVAVVTFPYSADVPSEIAHLQRFKVMDEMVSLVTWIHEGTWLDKRLLWGPKITSIDGDDESVSVEDLKQSIFQASMVTVTKKGYGKVFLDQTYDFKAGEAGCNGYIPGNMNVFDRNNKDNFVKSEGSNDAVRILVDNPGKLNVSDENNEDDSEDLKDTDRALDDVFCREIPDVNDLFDEELDPKREDSSEVCSIASSGLDDSDFL